MGTRLYVGNLPFGLGEVELRALFEEEDRKVVDVRLISDRMTGQPRGFGFVEMASEAEAQAAIQSLHGRSVQGRAMVVNEARDRAPGGGGGAGGPRPPYRGGPGGGDRPPPRDDRPPMGGGGPRPAYGPGGGGGGRPGFAGGGAGGGGRPGFGGGAGRPGFGGGGGRPGFGGGGGFGGPPGISKSGGERRRKPKSEKAQKEEKERERRASGRRKVEVEDWKDDLADTEAESTHEADYSGDGDDADE
ncbi:MAG: RNA-binding protein [Deltaproteobacteria bacterium]|nr:RNA-binding protein [Deltaproteobacteria bacterium]